MIVIKLHNNDWVWLCELLSQVAKDSELDQFTKEDTERILHTLQMTLSGDYEE